MAHREQAKSDLSTLDCPALLFGSVPLGERSAGYSTLTSLSGEPISAGAQFTGLSPRQIPRSHRNLLELGPVSTGGDQSVNRTGCPCSALPLNPAVKPERTPTHRQPQN